MQIFKNLFNKMKSNKGASGADVAGAITVILVTVGIVTAIYVNAINKSKDNLRYANAVRIATNIMENIQKKTFQEVITEIGAANTEKVVNGGNAKLFETKIPNGFKAKVTISTKKECDVARDITVNVSYKASMTNKVITINSVKEKELMDMTNDPDFYALPDYENSNVYYYPVIQKASSKFQITTTSNLNWCNYDITAYSDGQARYALVYKTSTPNTSTDEFTASSNVYAWVPRFDINTSGTGLSAIQFLYGTSENKIAFESDSTGTKKLWSYRKSGAKTFAYASNPFVAGDGLTGVWYELGSTTSNVAKTAYDLLNTKLPRATGAY